MSRRRVGFLGGSFDPPHVGHIANGLYALECANISELIVAPVYQHFDGKVMAPFVDRVRMTCALFDRLRTFSPVRVSMIEEKACQERPEARGRTADTLEVLRHHDGAARDATIVLVLGSDIKATLPTWDGYERLEAMIERGDLDLFWVGRVFEASSTRARNAVKAGTSTELILPPRVRRIIDERGLYR